MNTVTRTPRSNTALGILYSTTLGIFKCTSPASPHREGGSARAFVVVCRAPAAEPFDARPSSFSQVSTASTLHAASSPLVQDRRSSDPISAEANGEAQCIRRVVVSVGPRFACGGQPECGSRQGGSAVSGRNGRAPLIAAHLGISGVGWPQGKK